MIRNIQELYGLGAIPISRIFRAVIEPPREIIDVDYEDISDQRTPSDNSGSFLKTTLLLEQHINNDTDANSNNK